VGHSSSPDLVSFQLQWCVRAHNKLVPTPGPSTSKRKKEDPKPEENTPKLSRRSTRTTKPFPIGSPAPQETPTKADTETYVVTPRKETVFKVPLPPARPRKTFPPRPPPKKRSSANKTKSGSAHTKESVPEKIPKVGKIDKAIAQIQDCGVPLSEETEIGLFEPDGITRDIYVQGPK
jgi:hypothetical protein